MQEYATIEHADKLIRIWAFRDRDGAKYSQMVREYGKEDEGHRQAGAGIHDYAVAEYANYRAKRSRLNGGGTREFALVDSFLTARGVDTKNTKRSLPPCLDILSSTKQKAERLLTVFAALDSLGDRSEMVKERYTALTSCMKELALGDDGEFCSKRYKRLTNAVRDARAICLSVL